MRLLYYHVTDAVFDRFECTEDIGFHFGTLETARTRLALTELVPAILVAARLSVVHPLRLPDLRTWDPQDVLSALVDAGALDRRQLRRLEFVSRETLAPLLAARGYDGVVYDNETEGGGDSLIVFRPEQIRIVWKRVLRTTNSGC